MIIVILFNFVKSLSVILLLLLIVFIFIDFLLTFFTVLYNGCCLSNEKKLKCEISVFFLFFFFQGNG